MILNNIRFKTIIDYTHKTSYTSIRLICILFSIILCILPAKLAFAFSNVSLESHTRLTPGSNCYLISSVGSEAHNTYEKFTILTIVPPATGSTWVNANDYPLAGRYFMFSEYYFTDANGAPKPGRDYGIGEGDHVVNGCSGISDFKYLSTHFEANVNYRYVRELSFTGLATADDGAVYYVGSSITGGSLHDGANHGPTVVDTFSRKQLTVTTPTITTSKTFDTTTSAAVTVGTLSGVNSGDTAPQITATAVYSNANVGSGKTITVTYTLSGANADNYYRPDPYTVNTGEILQAPLIPTIDPANSAIDVESAKNITITFDEAVRKVDDSVLADTDLANMIELKASDASGSGIAFGATINSAKKVITINPNSDFTSEQVVYVLLKKDVIEGSSGNTIVSDDQVSTFTAADTAPPTLSSSNPSDDATGVSVGADIVLTFNEAVDRESGNIIIKKGSTVIETISVTDSKITGTGTTTITINPAATLTTGEHHVLIAATAFDDAAGNSYAGIADATTLSFTVDGTAPTVTFAPVDGATAVANDGTITITFDEAVRKIDDNALTNDNVDDLITLKASDASGSDIAFGATIDTDKKVITITPDSDFSSEQVVYVGIGETVEDSSNHAISATSATFTAGLDGISAKNSVITIMGDVSLIATESAQTILQLQIKDGSNQDITTGGAEVMFKTSLGKVDTVTDNKDGTYSAKLKSAMPGTATITATVNGVAVITSVEVAFTAGTSTTLGSVAFLNEDEGTVATDTSTTSTTISEINNPQDFSIVLRDSADKPLKDNSKISTVTVEIVSGPGTLSTNPTGSIIEIPGTDGDAIYNFELVSTVVGTTTVKVLVNTETGQTIELPLIVINSVDSSLPNVGKLAITQQPQLGQSGGAFAVQPIIEVRDASGSVITSDNTTVITARISSGTGSLNANGPETQVTVVNGIATFTGLKLTGTALEAYKLAFFASPTNYTSIINDGDLKLATAPTVVLTGPSDNISSAFDITATFSKAVTGFELSDITMTNGTVSDLKVTSPSVYTFTVTPKVGTILTASIGANKVSDSVGLLNTESNTLSIQAGSPAVEFEKHKAEIKKIITDEASRALRSMVAFDRRSTKAARTRFITDKTSNSGKQSIAFSTDGTAKVDNKDIGVQGMFNAQSISRDGAWRTVYSGEFDFQRDEDQNSSDFFRIRMTQETSITDKVLLGYYGGIAFGRGELQGTFKGDHSSTSQSIGAFMVNQLSQNIYTDIWATVTYNINNLSVTNGTLDLKSDYNNWSSSVGGSMSGVYTKERYILRPELTFSYGKTDIGRVGFRGTAYGLTDSTLSLDAGHVQEGRISISPEVLIPMNMQEDGSSKTTLSFAPRYSCKMENRSSTSKECGGGIGLNMASALSKDNLTTLKANIEYEKVGKSRSKTIQLRFEHNF